MTDEVFGDYEKWRLACFSGLAQVEWWRELLRDEKSFSVSEMERIIGFKSTLKRAEFRAWYRNYKQ